MTLFEAVASTAVTYCTCCTFRFTDCVVIWLFLRKKKRKKEEVLSNIVVVLRHFSITFNAIWLLKPRSGIILVLYVDQTVDYSDRLTHADPLSIFLPPHTPTLSPTPTQDKGGSIIVKAR